MNAYNEFISRFSYDRERLFLTFEESECILRYFETKLKDFCNKFRPHMPRNVFGTSLQYFKRFYLSNSVMDYHPKEILVTAAYLACKAEEFNVTMEQVCFFILSWIKSWIWSQIESWIWLWIALWIGSCGL